MKAEDVCQLVLTTCRSQGVADVAVAVTQSENTMIRFSNSEITVSDILVDQSAFIFVSDAGRRAQTSVSDLTKKSLVNSAKRVVESAKLAPPGDPHELPKGPFTYDPRLLESEPVTMTARKLVSYVKEGVEAAQRQGAERVAGSLIAENGKITLQTSAGAFGAARKSSLELSVRAFQSSVASGHSVSVAGSEKEFEPDKVGEEAGRLAAMAKDPVNADPGEYDAVLGPMVFGSFINQTGQLASAFAVDAGLSFLAGKIGQKVASDKVSLFDDATMAGTYGSTPFDSEGLPTRRTGIIEGGTLRSYLHNSSTAKKFGVASTANAGLVSPHPFNLVVGPGSKTLDEMIASVSKGIYVTNGWYLRYNNYQTGDFSTIPRDAMFLIKDGKIERSIKELRISDNMLRILNNVSELSSDRKWVRWWEVEVPTLTPSALVKGLRFTRSRM
ncbi:MAG: TldD/PmbA family protein [Methanomassiliicoccales archaeon]|nr:TldD/PmbA family protein [Methanomassiliicoccales archaeon]